MNRKIDENIDKLTNKLDQLKERRAQLLAREKSVRLKEERAVDARRKILLGAFVLSHAEPANFQIGDRRFVDFLVRDGDRKLFEVANELSN